MTRHFYALYCAYGRRTMTNDFAWPEVNIFHTKRERDEWVEEDWEHREEVDSKTAKYFITDQDIYIKWHQGAESFTAFRHNVDALDSIMYTDWREEHA